LSMLTLRVTSRLQQGRLFRIHHFGIAGVMHFVPNEMKGLDWEVFPAR
jgi:hypothetical protein